MKFEFSHDFIAKHVYDKSSAEAKARRKVESIVQRAHQRHLDNHRILLSKEDLAEITLFESSINFNEAEEAFIKKSKLAISRRRQLIIGIVTAAFIILSGLVIWALNEQRKARIEQKHSLATALAAKSYERQIKGDHTSALRFAQYAYQTNDRDASRQALYNSFFQRNKYYYHRSVVGDSNAIISADFITRDTPLLMTTSLSGNTRFWNQNLVEMKADTHQHNSGNVSISPNGKLLAIISDKGVLHLRERINKTVRATIQEREQIEQMYFSPTEELLLTVTREGNSKTWNFSGQTLDSLNNTSAVKSAAFSPNGNHIITLGPSNLKIWTKEGRFLENLSLANPQRVQFLSHAQERSGCFSFGCIYNGTQLSFWEYCPERKQLKKLGDLPDQSRLLMDMDISRNGQLALLVNYDYVDLFQLQFQGQDQIRFVPIGQLKGHTGFINQAIYNPAGDRLYTISDDQTIKLWLISGAARPFDIVLAPQKTGNQRLHQTLEHPHFMLTKNESGGGKVWDTRHIESPEMIIAFDDPISQIIASPNGHQLASLTSPGNDKASILQLWDSTGTLLTSGVQELNSVHSVHFMADNHALITFQNTNSLKVWNLDAKLVDSIQLKGNFSAICPSPADSNLLAVLSDRMEGKSVVGLYNIASDSLNLFYSTSELDTGGIVKFSPSGDYIMSIHFDKIEIWNLQGKLVESLVSYDESFSDAYFAREEKYLVAIDANQALIMDWTQIEKQLATVSQVSHALFSQDMAYLFIVNPVTNTLERWPFAPDNIIRQIGKMQIADLSEDEKRRHGVKQ